MRVSIAKYIGIASTLVLLGLCHQTQAQQSLYKAGANQNILACYSNTISREAGTSIFALGPHSIWEINNSESVIYEIPNAFFWPTNQPSNINGPLTPKSAVFCQFENRLWKFFDIGIRLRVETPPPPH